MMVLRVAGCMLMLSSCANAELEDSGMLQVHKMGDSAQEDCSKGGCKPPAVHLAPPGAHECDSGTTPSESECLGAVRHLAWIGNITMGRANLQKGSGGGCKDRGWGQVPGGCSSQSRGDWAAHYKSGKPTVDGCVGDIYQLVCSGPKICCQAMTAECLSCSADSTMEEFCSANPTTTGCPKKWTLLARQTYPFLFQKNQWQLNADTPDADNYAILDKWDEFKQNGGYRLKLEWPKDNLQAQVWEQTSNPVQDCKTTNKVWGVKGYKAVSAPYTGEVWGGLECGGQVSSLLDGTVSHGNWWYAVGSFRTHGGESFPGPGKVIKQVELWIETER